MLISGLTTTNQQSSSNNNYLGPFLTSTASSMESTVRQIVPVAGTLSNLSVRLGAAPGNGSGEQKWDFTVRKSVAGANSEDTAVTCEIVEAATTCTSSATVTFAAGDMLSIEADPTGASGNNPNNWSSARWAVTLTAN